MSTVVGSGQTHWPVLKYQKILSLSSQLLYTTHTYIMYVVSTRNVNSDLGSTKHFITQVFDPIIYTVIMMAYQKAIIFMWIARMLHCDFRNQALIDITYIAELLNKT